MAGDALRLVRADTAALRQLRILPKQEQVSSIFILLVLFGRFEVRRLICPFAMHGNPVIFEEMKWTETIQRWQRLNTEAQQQICWRRIPRQVALSMAFERENVDLSWLEKLHRQTAPPASLKPPTAS
jgi:hypothetical protein